MPLFGIFSKNRSHCFSRKKTQFVLDMTQKFIDGLGKVIEHVTQPHFADFGPAPFGRYSATVILMYSLPGIFSLTSLVAAEIEYAEAIPDWTHSVYDPARRVTNGWYARSAQMQRFDPGQEYIQQCADMPEVKRHMGLFKCNLE